MPGDKKPATPGADPDNLPLQFYLAQLETNQKNEPGKVGKIKIAWRHTGETDDDETSEKEPKRIRREDCTQTLAPTSTQDNTSTNNNTTETENEITLAQTPTQQQKSQKPLPSHKHTSNNAEEATTPVAVKIKRWEVRNRGEKEKSSNIKEGTKIQQDTQEETKTTDRDKPAQREELGPGEGLPDPVGTQVGMLEGGIK